MTPRTYFKKITPLLILLILALGISCKSRKGAVLEFETVVFEKAYEGCNPKEEDCTHVKMTYPKFTKGTDSNALQQINAEVNDFLEKPIGEGPPQAPDKLAQQLFLEFEKFKKEFPEAPPIWTVERTVKSSQPSPEILNLNMSEDTFLGGAHPNSFEKYLNLNPKTGKIYHLGNLFKEDYQDKLNEIAEKNFREQQKVPPQENLEDAGFFFKDGIFKLNDNYLITPTGLTFLYNPYEAAPYAMGPIEVQIPFEDIKGLLKEGGPLPIKP